MPGRLVFVLTGVASLAVAVFAWWVSCGDFLLLVAGIVVAPPVLAVLVWSFAVLAGGALTVPTSLRLWRHVGRSGRLALMVIGGSLTVTLVGTGTWCIGAAVAAAGVRALGPHAYTVLPASGDQECKLIADESGVLRSSNGRLFSVGEFGFARPAGSWRADEIQLPVREGDYSLEWGARVGTLSFRTKRFIAPDHLDVTCNR